MLIAAPSKPKRITRFIAWIAILATVLHALMPAVAQAHSGSPERLVELCSAFGIKKVALGAEQTPVAPEQDAHKSVCPVCAMACAVALPSSLAPLFFSALQAAAPPRFERTSHQSSPCLPPASRGPPLAS